MGFFDKVKASLNIGGAKLTISGPGSVQNGSNLEFQVVVAGGKMDQRVTDIKASLVMAEEQKSYNMGGGNSTSINFKTVAQDVMAEAFDIKAGETKEFSFSLPVQVESDGSDAGGMMGTLNKLNNMATNRKRAFKLKVVGDIEGSTDMGEELDIDITE